MGAGVRGFVGVTLGVSSTGAGSATMVSSAVSWARTFSHGTSIGLEPETAPCECTLSVMTVRTSLASMMLSSCA